MINTDLSRAANLAQRCFLAAAAAFLISAGPGRAADEKSKREYLAGKGPSLASQERNTERLQALRKRVREYEAALARGVPPPPVKAMVLERQPRKEQPDASPREALLKSLKENPMDKNNLIALRDYLSSSKDDAEKAELGTAYCLGCLVTDQWREGTRTSILMRRAYPDDPNVKLLSLTTFFSDCGKCGGDGAVSKKCDTCKGKKSCPFYGCKGGNLDNPDLAVSGRLPKCPQCAGKDKCRACKGTGKMDVRCGTCSGYGSNLNLQSIEKGYIKYLRGI